MNSFEDFDALANDESHKTRTNRTNKCMTTFCRSDTKVLSLPAMNREREKLHGAQKMTIYVREDIYLATKWALIKNQFSLIRLKRIDSFEWIHDFDHL